MNQDGQHRFSREDLGRVSLYCALGSACAILLSIAASQILLGLSLAALLASGQRLRLPRIWLPLALFMAGTVLSLALSPSPLHGLPQIKKLYVFSMLLVLFSTLWDTAMARRLFLVWSAIGAAVSCLAVGQFVEKWRRARALHVDFYQSYVADRVTGTMSHWMTFAGLEMAVLLMLLALLLFGPGLSRRGYTVGAGCLLLLGMTLLLNGTRTVWLGAAVAGIWLIWGWNRWIAVLGPVVLAAVVWLVPGPVHDRLLSITHPTQDLDSNGFRWIAFRTGVRMIEAHPIRGIGLDETKYHFLDYLPPDTPRPLPPGFYQHLHNFYLQFAAERGIPTMLMMIWLLLMGIWDFFVALRRLPPGRSNERFLLEGGIATIIGIMVSGVFEVNLGDSEVLTVFLVVVACAYVAVREAGQRRTGAKLA